MLTNTVGIVVFILIFTVLTASGPWRSRRSSRRAGPPRRIHRVLGVHARPVFPLRAALIRATKHDAPRTPGKETRHLCETDASRRGREALARSPGSCASNELDGRAASDEHLTLARSARRARGRPRSARDSTSRSPASPSDGGGLDASAIGRVKVMLQPRTLARLEPRPPALIFWVRPDGIAVYLGGPRAARAAPGRLQLGSRAIPTADRLPPGGRPRRSAHDPVRALADG
jgi:hypothetical protein